jgi:hypothetical protein
MVLSLTTGVNVAGIIKAKDVVSDAVARVIRLAAGYARGQVIPWILIEQVAGFDRESTHWPAVDRRWRRELRKTRGITTEAVPGVGLKLHTVNDQVNRRSEKRRARASRQLSRDAEELRATPDRELTQSLKDQKYRRLHNSRDARRKVMMAERIERTLSRTRDAGLYAKPVG